MTAMALLNWSRGPAFEAALLIFIFGMLVRILEIYLLGRNKDLAQARAKSAAGGFLTIVSRTVPARGTWKLHLPGYIWHIGFLLIFIFLAPHILIVKHYLGLTWSAWANSIIDIITIVTMAALTFLLFTRFTDPVRRSLSRFEDYLVWILTFLPLATGYMAMHRLGIDYTWMLALHILSVNLLLVFFPFTKLTHAVTLFIARWYTGANAGRKGIRI